MFVTRVWQYLFGKGIVPSTNVFGTWDPLTDWKPGAAPAAAAAPGGGRGAGPAFGGQFGGRGGGAGGGQLLDFMRPRVILEFPPDANDMLLSGGVLGVDEATRAGLGTNQE